LTVQIHDHQSHTVQGAVPLLVIDAWEHAWYLQYLNEKVKFFDAIWNVLNWKDVAQRFEHAQSANLVLEQVAERAA
jgi:Fe-Mn family superoxide dismutase